jgi:two-component system sensor histidine kinase/response regulator
MLVGDAGRLRQVVVNLVGNALKFTREGEVVLDVAEESRAGDRIVLHVQVRDTGIGIPAKMHERIFEAFAQADGSTTRVYGGTGLGLSISARLVRLMGGRIGLESTVGRGSTFHFTVELGMSDKPAPLRPAAAPEALEGLDVLVVDDNATNRLILREMLLRWRMRPEAVETGAAALTRLRAAADAGHRFPLVLLDCNMPGMDGFTLAGSIRQDPRLAGATVMMLTSAVRQNDGERCRELGIACHVTKPIRREELHDAIARALGARVTAPAGDPATVATGSPRPLRILLAEDTPVNQRLATGLLELRGHTVTVADNGEVAAALAERERFDLILMDVQMPVMDGLEATRLVRERERGSGRHRVPIVALTARAMKGDRELCMAAGMDRYLTKPLRAAELYATVDTLAALAPATPSVGVEPPGEALLERFQGNRELLTAVAETFLEHLPVLLGELDRAVTAADFDAVRRTAHSIKGSVGNFDHGPSFGAAVLLERLGRQGTAAGLSDAAAELHRATEALVEVLRKAIGMGKEVSGERKR